MIEAAKIRSLLSERLAAITRANPNLSNSELESVWIEYLNGIDCISVEVEQVVEELLDFMNHTAQGRVCVRSCFVPFPSRPLDYIFMPRELAERALVLGGLPDSWFPECSNS
jgi:hypothetical protein